MGLSAWGSVVDFGNYWINTKSMNSQVFSLGTRNNIVDSASNYADRGDVIQFYNPSKGRYDHSVFVVSKTTQDVYIDAHSGKEYHKALHELYLYSPQWTSIRVIHIKYDFQ